MLYLNIYVEQIYFSLCFLVDEVAPTLTFCPGPMSVIRTEVWGVEVTFDLPRAQDNADGVLSVTTLPENLISPFNFTEDAVASYTFTDSAGNYVTCSFSVYVQGNEGILWTTRDNNYNVNRLEMEF